MQNKCHRLITNQTGNFCTAQHFCRVFINPLALVTWLTKVLTYTNNGILGNMGTHRSTGNLCSRSNVGKKVPTKVISVKREHREAKTTLVTNDSIHVTSVTTVTL